MILGKDHYINKSVFTHFNKVKNIHRYITPPETDLNINKIVCSSEKRSGQTTEHQNLECIAGATTCIQASDAKEGHAGAISEGGTGPVLLVECFSS